MTVQIEISNLDDMIDIRDVIEAYEGGDSPELLALLEECEGNGGDEQWRGDWYPIALIRDSYFSTYAEELAEGIGAINADASWPNNCIDWEQASRELQMDYTPIEFEGTTYWCR